MLVVHFTLAILAATPLSSAQFVPEPTGFTTKLGHAGVNIRYKEVPTGICEQDPNVKSYSGYADVEDDQHIFWWFFEARDSNPTEAPLTVWINGGPGSSSMIGLFQELGPCAVDSSGTAIENPYSWSNISNMLFIDQPTQTGFSYSKPVPGYTSDSGSIITLPTNDCPDYASDLACGTYSSPDVSLTANSTPGAAPNFYRTLQGFFGAFPQYSSHDFYFATESYGGHYGPVFSQYILEQNKIAANGTVEIPLKGLLIGNGWFDPRIQYQAYYNYTVDPGNPYVDASVFYNSSVQSQIYNSLYGAGNCMDQLDACYATGRSDLCSSTDSFCYAFIEEPFDDIAGRDEYDSRELLSDPLPPRFYVDYLNTPEVQAGIGAFVNFSESSNTVSVAFAATGDDSQDFDIGPILSGIINSSCSEEAVYVFLYDGDADFNCNYLGVRAFIDELVTAPDGYTGAGYANITSIASPVLNYNNCSAVPASGLYGEVKQASNFAFARIFESGHEVPFYQPALSLELLRRVINKTDIATGSVNIVENADYASKGPLVSSYVEGNGTYQYEDLPADTPYDVGSGRPITNSTASSSAETSTASSTASSTPSSTLSKKAPRHAMPSQQNRLSAKRDVDATGRPSRRILDRPRRVRRHGRFRSMPRLP